MSRKLLALLAPGILLLTCSFVAAEDEASDDEQTLRKAGVEVDGNALLQQLRKRMPTEAEMRKAQAYIHQLASEDFTEREEASAALVALGRPYRPLLLQAEKDPDLEVSLRARTCLEQIGRVNDSMILAACTRTLARRSPPGAAAALLDFAPFAEEPTLVEEVAGALIRVGVKDGQAQPALITALSDPLPLKRALAGEALVRGGVLTQRAAARRLLQDPDIVVRERLAFALLEAHDRESVGALIRLMGELPPFQRLRVEDALTRLAGAHVPALMVGETREDQVRRVDAWKAWWQQRGAEVNLENYDPNSPLGYTLLCMMDVRAPVTGRIVEQDASGQVRWQIEGLNYPLDAQVLGSDRVLVAEYRTRQVTERNFHGDILWQYDAPTFVLSARRQANGNTVVVTREDVIDVDRHGREVGRIKLGLGRIAAAQRLPNRQTVVVSMTGEVTFYDASGQQVRNFNLNNRVYPIGCSIDVLPNGNVLIPFMAGTVVEADTTGKIVWQASVGTTVVAQRLGNGNTLVATRFGNAVSEIDKEGKVVVTVNVAGRVLHASRR